MTLRTTCPYCGVGCGVLATRTATGLAVQGDPKHPANKGRLCSKGSALGETVDLDGRLLAPASLVRMCLGMTPLGWWHGGFRRSLPNTGRGLWRCMCPASC